MSNPNELLRKNLESMQMENHTVQSRASRQNIIDVQNQLVQRLLKSKTEETFATTVRDSLSGRLCTSPVNILIPIRIEELSVGLVHFGKVLEVKTVSLVARLVATTLFVEDILNPKRVILLSIYNSNEFDTASVSKLNQIIPVGTILQVKEPYLKKSPYGEVFIRMDVAANVIRPETTVRSSDSSFEQWKASGDVMYKLKDYKGARSRYDMALEISPKDHNCISNRSSCLLALGLKHEALNDALSLDISRPGVCLRAGAAYHAIGMYKEARDMYIRAGSMVTDKAKAKNLTRLGEQVAGIYTSLKGKVADFVGPLEIVHVKGKGRGLVVTKDLKMGDLLMVSNALGWVESEMMALAFTPGSLNASNHSQMKLASTLSESAVLDRTLNKTLSLLHRGASNETATIADFEPQYIPDGKLKVVTNWEVGQVVKYNAFGDSSTKSRSAGLFGLPSICNHSCLPSAIYFITEELIFIRALKNLSKGDEVTLAYSQLRSFEERSQALSSFGFICECELCQSERILTPIQLQRRYNLVAEYENLVPMVIAKNRNALIPLQKIVKQMKATYHPTSPSYKDQLVDVLIAISLLQHSFGETGEDIQSQVAVLKSLGINLEANNMQIFDIGRTVEGLESLENAVFRGGRKHHGVDLADIQRWIAGTKLFKDPTGAAILV